jgi:ribosomal protein L29
MSKWKEALARIRDLPEAELAHAEARAREELFRLKLGNYTNQVENTISLRTKRRELARILTIQSARAFGFETQSSGTRQAVAGESTEAPARRTRATSRTKGEKKAAPSAKAAKAAKAKPAKTPSSAKATKGKSGTSKKAKE